MSRSRARRTDTGRTTNFAEWTAPAGMALVFLGVTLLIGCGTEEGKRLVKSCVDQVYHQRWINKQTGKPLTAGQRHLYHES